MSQNFVDALHWIHVHGAEILRWLNVALACISFATLVATLVRRWHKLSGRIRRIGLAFSGVLATVAYGSGEAAQQDVPPGVRVVMASVSLLALVIALLWRFDEDL